MYIYIGQQQQKMKERKKRWADDDKFISLPDWNTKSFPPVFFIAKKAAWNRKKMNYKFQISEDICMSLWCI